MLYRATHVTRYLYEEPVSQCLTEARLTPRSLPLQHVREAHIQVEPEPAVFKAHTDYFGNRVSMFTVLGVHDRLETTATSIVEVVPAPMSPPVISWEETEAVLRKHSSPESLEAYEFTFDSPLVAVSRELVEYARPSLQPGRPLVEAVLELSHRIHSEFHYQPKSTEIDMPLVEVLGQRRGVCQDFAHILIGALRSWRLAARYVSGYLRSGVNYQGAEASHAWAAVFIPEYGWLSIDPTNDVVPSEGHLTLAWGRDYSDVPPVKGVALGGGGQTVQVEVRVEEIQSKP